VTLAGRTAWCFEAALADGKKRTMKSTMMGLEDKGLGDAQVLALGAWESASGNQGFG